MKVLPHADRVETAFKESNSTLSELQQPRSKGILYGRSKYADASRSSTANCVNEPYVVFPEVGLALDGFPKAASSALGFALPQDESMFDT